MVSCDDSKKGLRGVLMEDGKVVACTPRQLKIPEHNYLIHDLELGRITFSLNMLRWMKLLKDYDFDISYHLNKNKCRDWYYSRKTITCANMRVQWTNILEELRYVNLSFELTKSSIKLGMLHITGNLIEQIKKGQENVKCIKLKLQECKELQIKEHVSYI